MLNLIIFAVLFFILVFSTFFVVQLPFIVFFFQAIPTEATLIYSDQLISTGFYQGNLQIPAIILSALLLNPRLCFFFMLTYFCTGFYGQPIFYYGGGSEYLNQASIGYLIAFFPVAVLLSFLAWNNKNYEKYLFNSEYTFFISLIALLLIHTAGVITAFFRLKGHDIINVFQVYFSIPFFSQVLLIAVICILATNLNRLKYYLLEKYKNFMDSIFKVKRKKPVNN
jgi:biotin transporter BioY